jgi:hypothetical protein
MISELRLTAICGYLALMKKADKSPEMDRYIEIIDERAEYNEEADGGTVQLFADS